MSGRGDMGRATGGLWLDDPTVEQLLDGGLAPDDAPPPLAPVAEWIRAARAPAVAAEWADEDALVAAIADRVRWAASLPAPVERPRRAPARGGVVARVAVLTAALALSGTGVAAAAEGTLPSPVQRVVSTAASWVGVSVPKDPPTTPPDVPDISSSVGLAPVVPPVARGATTRVPCRSAGRTTAASTRCAPVGQVAAGATPAVAPPMTVAPPAPSTTVPAPPAPAATTVPAPPAPAPSTTVPPTGHPPVSLMPGGPQTTIAATTAPPTTAPGTTVAPTTTVPTTKGPPPTTDPPRTVPTVPAVEGPPARLVPGNGPPVTGPPVPAPAVIPARLPPATPVIVSSGGSPAVTVRIRTRPPVGTPTTAAPPGTGSRPARPAATVLAGRVPTVGTGTGRRTAVVPAAPVLVPAVAVPAVAVSAVAVRAVPEAVAFSEAVAGRRPVRAAVPAVRSDLDPRTKRHLRWVFRAVRRDLTAHRQPRRPVRIG